MSKDDLAFLNDVLPDSILHDPSPIHVTLTFARSLDGKIAGCGGKQLRLSCDESMIMTHRLRSRHDAILVGIGTALNDNPQLNTRLLPVEDGGQSIPLPIILDSNLRFRLDSKLLGNYKAGRGRQPTIFTAAERCHGDDQFDGRRKRLEDEGVSIIPIASRNGKLDLNSLLSELQKLEIRSLMVEGGASVISSFFQSGLVKSLIVTVSPVTVGEEGIGYDDNGELLRFTLLRSQQVATDTVYVWKLMDNGSSGMLSTTATMDTNAYLRTSGSVHASA